MALYNRNFQKMDIDLKKLERLNSVVTNAIIYRYEDMILKKYWVCTQFAIEEKMFDVLSNIRNKHLMELYEIFRIIKDGECEHYKELEKKKGHLVIDGYTAKYYQAEKINPMTMDVNYLLHNIEGLKELIDIISENSIMMCDTKPDNTIINSEGIVLIDPDYYYFTDEIVFYIKRHNYRELLLLLRMLFIDHAEEYTSKIGAYFDDLTITHPERSIEQLEKDLKRVRRPIQIIDKRL